MKQVESYENISKYEYNTRFEMWNYVKANSIWRYQNDKDRNLPQCYGSGVTNVMYIFVLEIVLQVQRQMSY